MEKKVSSIAEILKSVSSLSEVAERFSISRPTLYKYMDCFDNGEYDRIPEKILAYFDAMSSGATPEESAIYLMAEKRRKEGLQRAELSDIDDEIEYRRRAIVEGSLRRGIQIAWTADAVPSICYPSEGCATVFFKQVLPGAPSTTVAVYLTVSGEPTPIGRFHAEPGMGFVNIRGLPKGPAYEYRVEQSTGGESLVSDAHPLVLG